MLISQMNHICRFVYLYCILVVRNRDVHLWVKWPPSWHVIIVDKLILEYTWYHIVGHKISVGEPVAWDHMTQPRRPHHVVLAIIVQARITEYSRLSVRTLLRLRNIKRAGRMSNTTQSLTMTHSYGTSVWFNDLYMCLSSMTNISKMTHWPISATWLTNLYLQHDSLAYISNMTH